VFHVPKKEAEGRVLLADGIHMGIHALAFGISLTAYTPARRYYIVQILLIKRYNNVNILKDGVFE